MILEYAENGDLKKTIDDQINLNKPFKESQILEWLINLADALDYSHQSQLLHRDLKVENIFINTDNQVKLGDFGMAKLRSLKKTGSYEGKQIISRY